MSSSSDAVAAKGKPAATIQELIDSEEDDYRAFEKQAAEEEGEFEEEEDEEDIFDDEEEGREELLHDNEEAGGNQDLDYSHLKVSHAKLGMKMLLAQYAQKSELLLNPIAAACAVGNVEMLHTLLGSRLFCPMKYVAVFFTLVAGYPNDEVACEMFRMIKAAIDACNGSEGNPEEYPYSPCLNCYEKARASAAAPAPAAANVATAPKRILK